MKRPKNRHVAIGVLAVKRNAADPVNSPSYAQRFIPEQVAQSPVVN